MKMTPLVLVPLIFFSCHGPSSSGTAHSSDSSGLPRTADSGKNFPDSTHLIARDSSRPARVDTPSTPMIARNWIGSWSTEDGFGGGSLHITAIKGKTFIFSMEATDGGASGILEEGSAKLQGYRALYTQKEYGGSCRIEFTFYGDSIYVDQQEGNCEAGAGVYYSGTYYKHPPKRPEETLLSLGILDNDTQDKKFRALVGDDYNLFVGSSQLVFEKQKDKDSLGAVVHQAAIKHMFTEKENIILINGHQDIWAAVINGDSVNYYTNRPDYKHRVPKTIDSWRENFNEKPIVFK